MDRILCKADGIDVSMLVHEYEVEIKGVLDEISPMVKVKQKTKIPFPWMTEDVKREIALRRSKERKGKASKSQYDYQAFSYQRSYVKCMIKQAKKEYFHDVFGEIRDDYKKVFRVAKKLLFNEKQSPFPEAPDDKILGNLFNDFFIGKIEKICLELESCPKIPEYIESSYQTNSYFENFAVLTEMDVRKLVNKSATKSCELDPISTHFLKQHLDVLIPLVTKIVNISLQTGQFPNTLKSAIVRPLLKKAGMGITFKDFSPVSNLSYLGKIIEGAACNQIMDQAVASGKFEKFQSAYRTKHSTKTTLLRVREEILKCMDKGEIVCLLLLDLSATFDTTDKTVLLNHVKHRFGYGGKVLDWISSYLTGRSQKVAINDSFSSEQGLNYGVPQGSLCSPLLFLLYMSLLGDLCRESGVEFQGYADDTQNWPSFIPGQVGSHEYCYQTLQQCVQKVKSWMSTNFLCLNTDKTEFIMFSTKPQLLKSPRFLDIELDGDQIHAVSVVRNLDFHMDLHLKNDKHINNVTSKCIFLIKKMSAVRNLLDMNTVCIIMQALVISMLDYCYSLLMGSISINLINCKGY